MCSLKEQLLKGRENSVTFHLGIRKELFVILFLEYRMYRIHPNASIFFSSCTGQV